MSKIENNTNKTLARLKSLHEYCRIHDASYRQSGNFSDGLFTLVSNAIAEEEGNTKEPLPLPSLASFSGMASVLKERPELQVKEI